MRKIIFSTFLSVAAASIVNAQATFGIHAGGTLNTMETKSSGITYKGDAQIGWKVGGVANLPLSVNFAFMPQLNALAKNSKLEITESGFTAKETVKLTYLELPLNFVYTSNGFFAGVGPSIGFGLSGKYKYEETGSPTEEADIKFDGKANDGNDNNYHLKSIDFGGQILAGYKVPSGLFFIAHYNLGVSNISPDNDVTVKNKYFGVTIGYFFKGGAPSGK
jgi:hypothetical protein